MVSNLPRWMAARALPVMASLALLAGGASAYAAVSCQAGPYSMHFEMQPQTPVVGSNQARLHITDGSGQPVTGAHVTVIPEMTGMAMATQPVQATEQGSGMYVAPMMLGMAGQWQVKVNAQSAAGSGQTAFQVTTGRPVGSTTGGGLPWPAIGGGVLAAAVLGVLVLRRSR